MVKFSDKGSGWHGESGPHSQARTLGYVPGRITSCPYCAGSGRESGSSDPRQSVTCPRCGGTGLAKTPKERKVRIGKIDKEGWSVFRPLKISDSKKREDHRRWLERFEKGMNMQDADFSFRTDHNDEIVEEHQKLMRQQHVWYGGTLENMMRVNQLKEEAVARLKNKYGTTGF